MSPNVNNFVSDLVTMAKALENEPGYQERIRDLERTEGNLRDTIMALETRIRQLKDDGDIMQERINKLEAERDDAEYRFLEADDAAKRVMGKLDAILGSARDAQEMIAVTKPEPIKADPMAEAPLYPVPEVVQSVEEQPSSSWAQGESVADPTSAHPAPTGTGTESEASSSEPAPGPYSGKRYWSDISTYLTRTEWLEGGGTSDDYDWRPEMKPLSDSGF